MGNIKTMKITKVIFYTVSVLTLVSCAQTTALVPAGTTSLLGPTITIATTGNAAQATLSYGTNEIIKRKTGKTTVELVSNKVQEPYKRKRFNKKFTELLKNNILETREKLFPKK